MKLRCRLFGHKMHLHRNQVSLWYACHRCGEHGWVGPRAIVRPK